ncbi:hypothetical protein Y1Q_0000320 [Alligator mississippiensis]|uniref:Uncharacterized protein n=1 Tax=Alligator mississippiensis TaxID=8496 RepID=A0A151LZA4_ALLMI|nr:hypothetical protein Y1Q_0000320 [Alligator mississippiensis]
MPAVVGQWGSLPCWAGIDMTQDGIDRQKKILCCKSVNCWNGYLISVLPILLYKEAGCTIEERLGRPPESPDTVIQLEIISTESSGEMPK